MRLSNPDGRGAILAQVPDLVRLDCTGRSRRARSGTRTSARSSPHDGKILPGLFAQELTAEFQDNWILFLLCGVHDGLCLNRAAWRDETP